MKRFAAWSFLSAFLSALFLISGVSAQTSSPKPDAEGFTPMFDGKTLDNWTGDSRIWSVQDGAIVGKTESEGEKKLTYNTFLVWKGDAKGAEVQDFIIRFDYRLTKGGNSGLQYRSWVLEDDPNRPYRVHGYQADFDGGNAHTGIMYGEGFRGILAHRGTKSEVGDDHQGKEVERFGDGGELGKKIKIEDWNSYEVVAKDFTFTHKVNGETMSICVDNDKEVRRKTGIVAFQAHVGPAMKVEIKNVRIKRLP